MGHTKIKVTLDNFEEIMREMHRIDSRIQNDAARQMVAAAAGVVVARAAELCPVDTGALQESIHFRIKNYWANTLAIVGPHHATGAHGYLVEYGHDLRTGGRHRKSQPKTPKIGRVAPRPFLRPALDETQGEQRAAMERVLGRFMHDLNL